MQSAGFPWLTVLIVLPLAAFALWVTIALSYSYATGERAVCHGTTGSASSTANTRAG